MSEVRRATTQNRSYGWSMVVPLRLVSEMT